MNMALKIVLLVLCALIGKSIAEFRCYACSFSASDSDQSCLTISDSTRTVECPNTYCTILRQEYMDPSGVVASFTRGCESQPDFLNHDISDDSFRTYYRACTSDLCNIGNGIESIAGGALSPTPVYNGENLLVPGTASGGTSHITISIILTFISSTVIVTLS